MTAEQLRELQETAELDLAYWERLAADRHPFVSVDGDHEEIDFDPWEWM